MKIIKTPIQIVEDVFLVGSEDLSGPSDCMVYAIGIGDEHICLIDAGAEHAAVILENISMTPLKGRKIVAMILTHCHYDHIGAAHDFLHRFPNLHIYAHAWDVPAIRGDRGTEACTAADWYGASYHSVPVHTILKQDREILKLGTKKLECLHTPGHTPGSIAVLYNTPQHEKVLFGQDIHGPFMKEFNSNIKDWTKSMKYLLSLDINVLCEGHYGIFIGKEKVKNFIEGQLHSHGF